MYSFKIKTSPQVQTRQVQTRQVQTRQVQTRQVQPLQVQTLQVQSRFIPISSVSRFSMKTLMLAGNSGCGSCGSK